MTPERKARIEESRKEMYRKMEICDQEHRCFDCGEVKEYVKPYKICKECHDDILRFINAV